MYKSVLNLLSFQTDATIYTVYVVLAIMTEGAYIQIVNIALPVLGDPKFEDGKIDLKDGPRPGQPKDSATKANAVADEDMTKQDAKFTLKEIATSVGISLGSVLTQKLKLRKVPHLLTEEQKVIRVKMAKVFLILKIKKKTRRISELSCYRR